jgi:predicted amidohydrolase YtcJ
MKKLFFFIFLIIPFSYAEDLKEKIFLAKELITLDSFDQESDAILVKKNKILAVGKKNNLVRAYPHAEIISDFQNDVIVPGFIEHHIHPLLAAITMNSHIVAIDDWTTPNQKTRGVRNRSEYIAKLQEINEMLEDGEPMISWGFHHYFHEKLTRQDLDKISNDRPILIIHRSFHEFIMNSKALEFFDISNEDIKNLTVNDKKHTNITEGHFSERGLIAVMPKVMNYLAAPERILSGMQITEGYLLQNGITLIANPGAMYDKSIQGAKNYIFGDIETPFKSLYIPSALYMLEHVSFNDLLNATEDQLAWGAGKLEYLSGHIKLFADGAMYSQNMMLRDGYLDGHEGAWLMEEEIFEKAFKLYWDAGYQIHVHQNGDAGLDRVLNVLEKNLKQNPRDNHRTTIVHFGYAAYDQVKKIKELGAIVSANPFYVTALSDLYSKKGVGFERSQQMVRLGDLEKEDIIFSLHSDMPMAPASPLILMHSAVNRINFANKVAGPNQRVSVLEALKGVTINAAFTLGIESNYGSISPGKIANFTVLSANPLSIDMSSIDAIKIIATIEEGKIHKIN